mmetsp:Transcript_33713/g.51705  ORF Transcript_33713/g.51705 Transcript_33713/m.51705 type:complete len:115 (+) Transcript_33713:55-399(+)
MFFGLKRFGRHTRALWLSVCDDNMSVLFFVPTRVNKFLVKISTRFDGFSSAVQCNAGDEVMIFHFFCWRLLFVLKMEQRLYPFILLGCCCYSKATICDECQAHFQRNNFISWIY